MLTVPTLKLRASDCARTKDLEVSTLWDKVRVESKQKKKYLLRGRGTVRYETS
ncbi:hypothetical protein CROQUDRAFT_661580 [Cronartium quercuum f. sp. fusiforme G11]|uniref:Uncharacterized protein n=1 Tax=Cronartium quercuum f. sp. fusiforme G11 TaxID=708437 RepID=A0A9P6T8N3_9BASI|nr:hypothetical protein CROQUDRAFT_661580 [Cronartium quercuum f. sp. fusiforme G11]